MKFKNLFYIFIVSLILNNCINKKATEAESVQFDVRVCIYDTSFVTKAITNDTVVADAFIQLFSVNFDLTYEAWTDSTGKATFQNIIPDFYNCSIQKTFPEDTVKLYLPINQEITLVGSIATYPLKSEKDSIQIFVQPVLASNLLISEIYYNGALPPPGFYFHDQFTEIYNNSSEVEYLDNYAIGDVEYGYRDDPDYLYCIHLYKFPGSGTDYPIYPGESVIVAQDAINHTEYNVNSLDLTISQFEYFNHLSGDVDNPQVANMIQLHHKYGHDFLYSVFNDAIVLFKLQESDTVFTYGQFDLIQVPLSRVIDGVDYRENTSEYEYKRLPDLIDAGLTGGFPAYKGKSIARKVFKIVDGQIILTDNNNSSLDFKVLESPTPGQVE